MPAPGAAVNVIAFGDLGQHTMDHSLQQVYSVRVQREVERESVCVCACVSLFLSVTYAHTCSSCRRIWHRAGPRLMALKAKLLTPISFSTLVTFHVRSPVHTRVCRSARIHTHMHAHTHRHTGTHTHTHTGTHTNTQAHTHTFHSVSCMRAFVSADARGYVSQWEQFHDQIEPIATAAAYMTAIGNHERDWPGTGAWAGGKRRLRGWGGKKYL